MEERIGVWNLLHDGEITAASSQADQLTLFVSIPYLRRRLSPMGDSFVLNLKGVKTVEFRNFEGKTEPFVEQLEVGTLEILGTNSSSLPVCIDTTLGQLILDFENVSLALDTGQPSSIETLDRIAQEYWSEWEARAAKAREP